jgi:YYY domain-containing protein
VDSAARPSPRWCALGVFALVVVAAALRFQGLDWDEGQHLHPDERFLTMVETAIKAPRSLADYFDTAHSPLNPGNNGYGFFVYGTLPLFLVHLVAAALGMTDYGRVHLVGRTVSATFDLGTVWLTYSLGARLFGRRTGLLACALAAFSVTSIQNAHFFTVDSAATFFATASLRALLAVAETGSLASHVLFGAAFGAMLGCRINLALLGAVYPIAFLHAWRVRGRSVGSLVGAGVACAAVAAGVFRAVQPYAFAGPGFFGAALAPQFLASMAEIRSFATGAVDYPPSVQWIGRTPVLFAGRNLFLWGIGPAWGAAALAGIAWWLFARSRSPRDGDWLGLVALAWAIVLFGVHSVQFAATLRYFLPVVPVLGVFAAWPLAREPGRLRVVTAALLVGLTAAWAVAFTAIYRRPVTRVEASRWIYRNIPAGATLATEHWDDGLPLALPDAPPVRFHSIELHLYDDDTDAKVRALIDELAAADYVVLSSNRLYRSIPRTPWRYPVTRRYYELLFSGELGFRLDRSFTSYPRLGPREIRDDEAEEAFTVYDHPHVLIFKKTAAATRENLERLLGRKPLPPIVHVSPREASALYRQQRPTDVPLPESEEVRTAVAGAEPSTLDAALRWFLLFETLSLSGFALLFPLLRGVPDRGYGLGKLIAWLGPGYTAWLACATGVAANTPALVRAVVVAFVAAAAASAWGRRHALAAFWHDRRREALAAEGVFLAAAGLFLAARSLNPAIFWGEKPMDFAILNAITRSRTMPPVDPWFAGRTLNYYYFGHALVAFFAEAAGVTPAFAFNLAIGTVAGLLALAAFLVGRQLGGSTVAGALAAVTVTLLGNLDGLRRLVQAPHRPIDFNYYWATSRVIEGTINEFPAWNLLFADLHAHVLAQPLEVALLYLGLLWLAPSAAGRLTLAALAAWFIGAVGTTSVWSLPTMLALQLTLLITAWRHEEPRGLGRFPAALGWWLLAFVGSRLLYEPFWATYRSPARPSWGWETASAPLADVLTIFGVFLVALTPALLRDAISVHALKRSWHWTSAVALCVIGVAWIRSPSSALFAALLLLGAGLWWREGDPHSQAVGVFVSLAGGLGIGTETLYVWDRMNTIFKYYLEIWLLLGCACGLVVPSRWRGPGRWRVAWQTVLLSVAGAALFTTLSGAFGLIRYPFVPSDAPTLDGMNYLSHSHPAELAAFRWLNREIVGVPVLLEAQGDSYRDFSRVSMNTGLPTVLGWEYHLFQQARSWPEIYQRRDDVRELFSTTDEALAAELMRKYHVDLVFVGGLERRTYPASGLAKFATWELTKPVFESGDVTIYATPGLVHSVKTWIEPVEAAGASWTPPFGSFREPRAIARAPDGTLWVADFGNRRLQHVDAHLRALGGFGSEGDAPGRFHDPCGVAVGADGSLYVADTWNHRVQKLTSKGTFVAEWTAGFYGPRGIALDRAGRVYVADTGNSRVVRLDTTGAVEREWGREDERLAAPVGIAVSPQGEVFVADTGHRRVVVFTADGQLVRQWPIDGWDASTMLEPYLDVGRDGVVWVTDPSRDRVLLFDSKGQPLGAARGREPLSTPLGVAVLDDRHAAVANAGSHSLAMVARTPKTSVVPER